MRATPPTHCVSNCTLGRFTTRLQHYDEACKASSSKSFRDNLAALRFKRSFFRFSFFCNCRSALRCKLTRRRSSWRYCNSFSASITALCKAVPLSIMQTRSQGNHANCVSIEMRNSKPELQSRPKQSQRKQHMPCQGFRRQANQSGMALRTHSISTTLTRWRGARARRVLQNLRPFSRR